ncbi:MAG: hypothetical protein M3N47_07060 [Chloroflexota bacterium]|nr:hypothetical protein [Chloroflexota bacterium]
MEVEDGLGGQRPAVAAAGDGETSVQGDQLVGVDLAELDVAGVGTQVVLDRGA